MKKTAYILAGLCLILSTLACRLPFAAGSEDAAESTSAGNVPDRL